MKTNELTSIDLMVGDWLKHYNGTPMQVTKITTEHFACTEKRGMNCWEYNNKYEPIPLTPEILEKNGFNDSIIEAQKRMRFVVLCKEHQITYSFNSNWFSIYKNANESESDYPIFICAFQERINYVHQLQHALKLCKIDKEIKL